jgi:RNA polymerase sigma-70 factor, ECF subfamily
MSSAALVPSLLERPEPTSPWRAHAHLSVCPPSVCPPAAAVAGACAERVGSVPPAPSVARLHAGDVQSQVAEVKSLDAAPLLELPAPTPAPANAVSPACGREPFGAGLEDELVAMLPSLERRAYRWCRDAAEAQDLAQDTVMRALGSGPSFDSAGHLRAWLYTVLRNLFISRRRRAQSWQRACGELSGLAHAAPAAAPAAAFLTPSVERALARLPEAFARVVRLVDLEDYSYADAANTLGVPVGTVMSRLFRARQRLAQDLPALV